MYVDGEKVAEGHIPKTQPFVFSADEGVDVGLDGETPVSNDYAQGNNAFSGVIQSVTIDIAPANPSAADQKKADDGKRAATAAAD